MVKRAYRYRLTIGCIDGEIDFTGDFRTRVEAVNFVSVDTGIPFYWELRLYRTGHIYIDETNSNLDTGGRPKSWYAHIDRLPKSRI